MSGVERAAENALNKRLYALGLGRYYANAHAITKALGAKRPGGKLATEADADEAIAIVIAGQKGLGEYIKEKHPDLYGITRWTEPRAKKTKPTEEAAE